MLPFAGLAVMKYIRGGYLPPRLREQRKQMSHPFHNHRQSKVDKHRVGHVLKSAGDHSDKEADKKLFSHLISQHESGEMKVGGGVKHKRYARGGRVKHHHTNIAIVVPHGTPAGAPPAGPARPPLPAAVPAGGPPPGMPPGGPPPGMPPMQARGGRVHGHGETGRLKPVPIEALDKASKDTALKRKHGGRANPDHIEGTSTPANLDKWKNRASKNSYARGGAIGKLSYKAKAGRGSGEGTLEYSKHMKGKI